MPTVTIRNLPDGVVANIKQRARARGWSMEHEIRLLLEQRYTTRTETWRRIDALREQLVGTLPTHEIVAARHDGRRR